MIAAIGATLRDALALPFIGNSKIITELPAVVDNWTPT